MWASLEEVGIKNTGPGKGRVTFEIELSAE